MTFRHVKYGNLLSHSVSFNQRITCRKTVYFVNFTIVWYTKVIIYLLPQDLFRNSFLRTDISLGLRPRDISVLRKLFLNRSLDISI